MDQSGSGLGADHSSASGAAARRLAAVGYYNATGGPPVPRQPEPWGAFGERLLAAAVLDVSATAKDSMLPEQVSHTPN